MENSPIRNLEEAATEALQSLNESCKECRSRCADRIREAPLASVGFALGIGFLFRWIPVAAVLGMVLKLFTASIRPLLVLFGLAKLIDLLKSPPTPKRPKNSGSPKNAKS